MNPFFQNRWMDAHTAMIGYLRDTLNGELPDDLAAQAEEGVRVAGASGAALADEAVIESWKKGFPPVWQPRESESPENGLLIEVTEPHIIEEETPARWIEIRAVSGALVTVIEIVSPSNKRDGRATYLAKRENYRFGGVNVVEIDLLRGGEPLTQIPASWRQQWTALGRRLDYEVAVWRASVSRIEAYPISLRERLPALRVPLRPADPDVPLPLQPIVDRCHRNGRYWQLTELASLQPPLSDEDARWAHECPRAAGLATA